MQRGGGRVGRRAGPGQTRRVYRRGHAGPPSPSGRGRRGCRRTWPAAGGLDAVVFGGRRVTADGMRGDTTELRIAEPAFDLLANGVDTLLVPLLAALDI